MRFEEADHGRKQRRIGGAAAKLVRPDSGQVEEAAGPPLVAERCRKRGKRECDSVIWT